MKSNRKERRSTSKKTAPKKQKRPMLLDVFSPDGFTIRLDDQALFKNIDEAWAYFRKWKNRYKKQGYYSSSYGRIELKYLAEECTVVEVEDEENHLC